MFDLPEDEHVDELLNTLVTENDHKTPSWVKEARNLYDLAKLAFFYSGDDLEFLEHKGYLNQEDLENLYKARALIVKATNKQLDFIATPDEEEIEETDEMEEIENVEGEAEDEIEKDEDEVEVVEISDEKESKSPLTPVSRENIFNYSDDNEEKHGWFNRK